MSLPPHVSLTRLDSSLLRFGQRLVPADERAEWLRSWEGELCYSHSHARCRGQAQHLTVGLLLDALWLRTDSWRTALSGTASLCLVLLVLLVGLAALPMYVYAGSRHSFMLMMLQQAPRFVVASVLTLFVGCVNATGSIHRGSALSGSVSRWMRARAFFTTRITLLLLLTFLISTDLCLPLEFHRLFVAMPLQLLLFVILALLGLRWSFLEGERRCKHCLRSLTAPARVGRPSWNFLEYNGTELACRDGHGLLSIPEIETSWCRSSAWIPQRLP